MSALATARLDYGLLALTVLAAVTNDQWVRRRTSRADRGVSLPVTRRMPRLNAFRQAGPEFVEFDDPAAHP
jgi:hypothetical protein